METTEKVNILLVDDQPGKLLTYQAMLSELGENLIMANSGREALEILLKTDVRIVLMDVSMPDVDGFELAEIIRQHPRYQKTAIIFVSAVHLTDVDVLKGYESGAVDYVSVPVVPELLRAKVRVFAELYRKSEALERFNRELEQRVAERTEELEAAAAKQVELTQYLRQVDRRKDEFLAQLSHELRNPLAGMRNATTLLRYKVANDPELLWCHDVIDRQSKQLIRLVDDLLDVSRITRGKINVKLEPVDLSTTVGQAVETSQPIITGRRHQLDLSLPSAPVVVQADAARLTQVIANLLNNAAKFQDEGGRIELKADRDGVNAIIAVRDYGIGMTEEMVAQVFELFWQAERDWHRSHDGLGIGLSLVKQLVELQGGTVTAASAGLGQGSEFTVRLPCAQEQVGVLATDLGQVAGARVIA